MQQKEEKKMITTKMIVENRYSTLPGPIRNEKPGVSAVVNKRIAPPPSSHSLGKNSKNRPTPSIVRPWTSHSRTNRPPENESTVKGRPKTTFGLKQSSSPSFFPGTHNEKQSEESTSTKVKQKKRPSSSIAPVTRDKPSDEISVVRIAQKKRPSTSVPYGKSKHASERPKLNLKSSSSMSIEVSNVAGSVRQKHVTGEYLDTSALAAAACRNNASPSDKVQAPKQRASAILAPTIGSAPSTKTSHAQPWSVTELPEEEEETKEPEKPEVEKKLPLPPRRPSLWSRVSAKKAILLGRKTQPSVSAPAARKPPTGSVSKPIIRQNTYALPHRKRRVSLYFDTHRPLLLGPEEGSSGELFQILTTKERKCLITETRHASNGDAAEAETTSSSSSEEDVEVQLTERRRQRRIANKPRQQTLEKWVDGPAIDSEDYDTDLEEDFPPEPETVIDATGAFFYEDQCRKKGVVPVRYLLENMGEGNLRMRHHYLGGPGTKPLAQALKRNTITEEIDLSDNYIEGQGAAALADTLKDNMFIVNLNVSNNFIKSEGAEKMAEMLEANTTLKTLSLQGNQLSDQDAKRISEALKNNMSLSCMDLSHNQFGEIGGICLAQGIAANIGLADLDLSWNCLREKGGVAIAKALAKNSALEILDLSWNGLAYTGTVALAAALKSNKSLKVLDISNNRLNPEGAIILGKALSKNVGLETLLMGLNPIGADGVESVLKGAAAHPRLKLLGIENTMDLSMEPKLLDMVKSLQESRDIMIMATTGPPQQSRINSTVLAVFDRFLTENADRMEDLFRQMDKDGSGDVTLEELKYGLKDFGLRLTSKQLDTLLEELDADKSGTIEYDELMQGSALIKREKQKIERAAAEAMLFASNAAGGAVK